MRRRKSLLRSGEIVLTHGEILLRNVKYSPAANVVEYFLATSSEITDSYLIAVEGLLLPRDVLDCC